MADETLLTFVSVKQPKAKPFMVRTPPARNSDVHVVDLQNLPEVTLKDLFNAPPLPTTPIPRLVPYDRSPLREPGDINN